VVSVPSFRQKESDLKISSGGSIFCGFFSSEVFFLVFTSTVLGAWLRDVDVGSDSGGDDF